MTDDHGVEMSACRDPKELVEAKADGDESGNAAPTLTDNDRMPLADLADEGDDVLRRVTALKSRLEPV